MVEVSAWKHSQAIGNVLSAFFGGDPLPFDKLFPTKKEIKAEPEKIKTACAKHGMRPPTKF